MSIPASSDSLNLPSNVSNSALNATMSTDVQNYATACDAYSAAKETYNDDMDYFNELAQSDPMLAFFYYLEVCSQDLLSAMEAQINVFSTSMNISNDLRTYVTDATNKFNAGQSMTQDQATAFYNDINDLEAWTQYLSGESGSDFSQTPTSSQYIAPIDTTNANSLISDCESIKNQFAISGWTPYGVQLSVQTWFTVSTSTDNIASYAPDPQIKSIQEGLQEANSSVSTLSSAQQTSFQFYVQQYNQTVASINSLMTSEIDGEKSMIANQKTA